MDSPQLSAKAKEIILGGRADIFVSAATSWEIAIKCQKGKLLLPESPEKYVVSRISHYGFLTLPIQISHTLKTYSLPAIHTDPFDRLLIAQCLAEEMSMITADEIIKQFPINIIW
jgi:PIN domain nuclease of toxin-antitoxin system